MSTRGLKDHFCQCHYNQRGSFFATTTTAIMVQEQGSIIDDINPQIVPQSSSSSPPSTTEMESSSAGQCSYTSTMSLAAETATGFLPRFLLLPEVPLLHQQRRPYQGHLSSTPRTGRKTMGMRIVLVPRRENVHQRRHRGALHPYRVSGVSNSRKGRPKERR